MLADLLHCKVCNIDTQTVMHLQQLLHLPFVAGHSKHTMLKCKFWKSEPTVQSSVHAVFSTTQHCNKLSVQQYSTCKYTSLKSAETKCCQPYDLSTKKHEIATIQTPQRQVQILSHQCKVQTDQEDCLCCLYNMYMTKSGKRMHLGGETPKQQYHSAAAICAKV